MRLFVGIELDGAAREAILAARTKLTEAISRQGVRFVHPDKLHVTVAFLGQVDAELLPQLMAALDEIGPDSRPFRLSTASLGCFPDGHRPKVIWIGLDGEVEALSALAVRVKDISRSFAPELDEKPLVPHITLARVSPGSRAVGTILRHQSLEVGDAEMNVHSMVLFHSRPDGSYEALHRIALAAT